MRSLVIVALVGCGSHPAPSPAPAPEIVYVPHAIEHRVSCGEVTAIWRGHVDSAYESWDSLAFQIRGKTRTFIADLTDQHQAMSFDIFSPDCTRVLLLRSRMGPFHIVRTDRLAAYLGGEDPEFVLSGVHDPRGITGTGVFRGGGWESNTEVDYTWGCCEDGITTRFVMPRSSI